MALATQGGDPVVAMAQGNHHFSHVQPKDLPFLESCWCDRVVGMSKNAYTMLELQLTSTVACVYVPLLSLGPTGYIAWVSEVPGLPTIWCLMQCRSY